jgi:hypothetical protein
LQRQEQPVGEPSFISSFRSFRHVPAGALFAAFLFIFAEAACANLWRPTIVGERLYRTFSPAYDYGFGPIVPRMYREGQSVRFYDTEYVNIRPFSISARKPPSTVRIFTLGASVSRGSGLPTGADYSFQLATLLNQRHPDQTWEVVNLSADGFGTTRILNVLVNVLEYEPDILIFHPHGSNEYEDEFYEQYRQQLHSGLNGLLLRSRILVLMKKMEERVLGTATGGNVTPEGEEIASLDPENNRRWMTIMQANLERWDCIAEALRLPTIYIGRAERDAESYRSERVAYLNNPIRSKTHFVDVASAFNAVADEYSGSDLFFDNTHYNEIGHQIVARELYGLVRPGGSVYEEVGANAGYTAPPISGIENLCTSTAE